MIQNKNYGCSTTSVTDAQDENHQYTGKLSKDEQLKVKPASKSFSLTCSTTLKPVQLSITTYNKNTYK